MQESLDGESQNVATRTDFARFVAAPFWGMLWLFTAGRMGRRPPFERWFRRRRSRGNRSVPPGPLLLPPPADFGGHKPADEDVVLAGEMGWSYNDGVLPESLMDRPPGQGGSPRIVGRIRLNRNEEAEDNNFYRAYAAIESMSLAQVRDNLLKLGRWPAERIVVRVLDWEEAVERLKSDTQASLAMVRAVVAIEDADGRLYVAKTPELATGLRMEALKAMDEVEMNVAVREGYKIH